MNIGLIGGIAGSTLGLVGGLLGAYFSFKNAKGPRERHFVIWMSMACFVYVGSFLAVLFLFPQSRPEIFVPYVIILVVGINYSNRRQSTIRQEEQPRDCPLDGGKCDGIAKY